MADFYAAFSTLPQYQTHVTITQGAQSIPGNASTVNGVERVEKLSGSGYFTGSSGNTGSITGSITVNGNGWAPYDFTGATTSKTIGSGSGSVVHNADGTKTASGSFAANDSAGGNMGAASGVWALALTRIPRGPQLEFDGAWAAGGVQVEFDGAWAQGLMYAEYNGAWEVVA